MAADRQFFTNLNIEMLAKSTTDFYTIVLQIWYFVGQMKRIALFPCLQERLR
jgi:hypothetical protein